MLNTNTSLHLAVQNGNTDIVKMLLAAGHSPSEVNAEGLSPLSLAVTTNNVEIVQLLTAHIEANNRGGTNNQVIPPPEPEIQNLTNNSWKMTPLAENERPENWSLEAEYTADRAKRWSPLYTFYVYGGTIAFCIWVIPRGLGFVKPGETSFHWIGRLLGLLP